MEFLTPSSQTYCLTLILKKKKVEYLSQKHIVTGKLVLKVSDFLIKHSNHFERAYFIFTGELSGRNPNGTITGLEGLINRSEIAQPLQLFNLLL